MIVVEEGGEAGEGGLEGKMMTIPPSLYHRKYASVGIETMTHRCFYFHTVQKKTYHLQSHAP
jgi:hypothetical protein